MGNEVKFDVSIMDSSGNILFESFDYESEEEAEEAANAYIEENNLEDYLLDISSGDEDMEREC